MDQQTNNNECAEGFRCKECQRLLARENTYTGEYEIKCVRCGVVNSIFKGFNDQVVVTDPNGTVIYANPVTESITGYKLSEILGQKPSLWGGQMSKQFYSDMWNKIKVEKKSIEVSLTNKKKDGSNYDVKLHITPVLGSDDEIKMFVGIETLIK